MWVMPAKAVALGRNASLITVSVSVFNPHNGALLESKKTVTAPTAPGGRVSGVAAALMCGLLPSTLTSRVSVVDEFSTVR